MRGNKPMTATADPGKFYIRAEDLERVGHDLLVRHDLPSEDAATVARCLVEADLRGVETHGVVRLTHYLNRVRLGLIKPRPEIKIDRASAVAISVDGDNGFGFVVAERAMAEAIAMAREHGIGMASVKRSNHFGMAASYVLQAVRAGFMSMVFTNASRAMPPWGGREPLLGTSPFAAGAPGGKLPPFVLDMAVAVAARGKIRLAAKRGESIPEGFGLDKDGQNTTDPNKVLDGGIVLPVGGPKGSAIAMMMDIFSGVFSGSAFAGDVTNHTEEFTKPQDVGHFMLAIKPDLFMPMAEFTERMDVLTGRVKAVTPAHGVDEVLISGEPESRQEQARRLHGIQLPKAELDTIKTEAERYGVAFPALSATPFAGAA
jgi:LDH2 family malate/lactate/ureidoglycolate dehydrogenase